VLERLEPTELEVTEPEPTEPEPTEVFHVGEATVEPEDDQKEQV
jgi:hypothetical protein